MVHSYRCLPAFVLFNLVGLFSPQKLHCSKQSRDHASTFQKEVEQIISRNYAIRVIGYSVKHVFEGTDHRDVNAKQSFEAANIRRAQFQTCFRTLTVQGAICCLNYVTKCQECWRQFAYRDLSIVKGLTFESYSEGSAAQPVTFL